MMGPDNQLYGGYWGATPAHPHPYLRLYFLPSSEKAKFERRKGVEIRNMFVISVAETPDYFVATSLSDINSGRMIAEMERSLAPLGRALEKYFGRFADERTGEVLGMETNASDGLTTGIGATGQVVDDQTGKPIKEFRLEWSAEDPEHPGGDLVIQSNFTDVYFGGRFGSQFEYLESPPHFPGWNRVEFWQGGQSQSSSQTYLRSGQKVWARIQADGYLTEPVTPEPLVWPVKLTNVVVRLRRASASAPGQVAKSPETVLAEMREILPEDWNLPVGPPPGRDGRFAWSGDESAVHH